MPTRLARSTATPIAAPAVAPAISLHGAVLLAYTLLTTLMTWPLLRHINTAIPGDGFDGWQNYWNLWWIKVALVERVQNPWQTDLLYAPTGVGLYFHTLNPFNGLLTLPVQLSGSLLLAYNTVVWFSWVMAGYGTFLLTRWLLRPRNRGEASPAHSRWSGAAAFCAGLIFTFAPFHMAHLLGHMQVMSLEWIPFYVLSLMQALDRRRGGRPWLGNALLAGFFLVLVGLCDWYFVLYLFFFTGLLLLWHLLGEGVRSRSTRNVVRALRVWLVPPVVAALFFALVLSPVLLPTVREATQFSFMVRPVTDLYELSASVADFVIPNRLHTLFRPGSFAWLGNQVAPVSERTIAVGYVPLLLALCALLWARKRALFWLVGAGFFFLLALGPVIHFGNITGADIPAAAAQWTQPPGWTPFAVLNRSVPFMRISRSVSRYALMVQLCVAIAAGMGLAAWLRRSTFGGKMLVASLAVPALLLAEYWVAPYPISPPDTPPFYAELSTLPPGTVLNLPMNYDRPGYLLYQTVHEHPLAVAYISRDDPRTLTERVPVLQHFRHLGPDILAADVASVGATVLNDLGVGYVVLDRYKMPGGDERTVTEALAAELFPEPPLYADDRLTVHVVTPIQNPVPYLELGALNWGSLQTSGEKPPARLITRTPAALHIRHAAEGAALRIRYRSSLETNSPELSGEPLPLRVQVAGEALEVLSTAEGEITVQTADAATVELSSTGDEGVWIEWIELVAQ